MTLPLTPEEVDLLEERWELGIPGGASDLFASHRAQAEQIEALNKKVYQPGVFKCAKCNFQLVQASLNANTGTVSARDAPGAKCPNDGSPMWRVSYQEDNAAAWKWGEEQFDRALAAEAQLAAQAPLVEAAREFARAKIINSSRERDDLLEAARTFAKLELAP